MRSGRAGFSALELVVVVAIAGVMMAWSYPRLASLSSHYRLDGAAWNLATALQKTRLRAIAEGTRFQVVFDAAQKTYQVQKEGAPGVFANDGAARQIEESGGIGMAATATPIFTTRGALETGTTCVVTLSSPAGGARLVSAQLGGRVLVQ
ncbi:MAG: pilus assembly FimT family protein [Candidatus Binatia bacterium]